MAIRHTKAGNEFKITDYYSKSMPKEEMMKERRRLAKVVNQRMRRMHEQISPITGERYDEWGSVLYVKDYLEREGRELFSENLNHLTEYADLRRELTVLRSFVESGSSTVGQQKRIEKKRVSTFESGRWGGKVDPSGKKTGTGVSIKTAKNKEFYDFLNSNLYRDMVNAGFQSEDIIEIFDAAVIKDHGMHESFVRVQEAMEAAYTEWIKDSQNGLKEFEQMLDLHAFPHENAKQDMQTPVTNTNANTNKNTGANKKKSTSGRRSTRSAGSKRKTKGRRK